jgi:hypothetical protein
MVGDRRHGQNAQQDRVERQNRIAEAHGQGRIVKIKKFFSFQKPMAGQNPKHSRTDAEEAKIIREISKS